MVACNFYHCLYVAVNDTTRNSMCYIIRLEMPSKRTEWKVGDYTRYACISVTSSHHLLVFCHEAKNLKLFSTDGVLHKTVELPRDLVSVSCAVELMPGQYVVTHGRGSDILHQVCVFNNEGKILRTFGGFPGSLSNLLNSPSDVAVDKDGFVYVDDERNDRLIVLTQDLDCTHWMPHKFARSSHVFRRRMKVDKESEHISVAYHDNSHYVTMCKFEIW